ncbi:MAG: NAD(P)-binding domain-containing protein [Bacteroidales bacterium]|nr:NAD(P)-binding domain-containing protein [Bacteroidales bacterium]MDY4174718.1 NAD(P)H-dependent glycerol-3-phosphate dehydrogenase [Bacteroidales bacterium]
MDDKPELILGDKPRVGLIGSGSWATAIAKMLLCNVDRLNWHVRSRKNIEAFKLTGRNPSYLTSIQFDVNKIAFSDDVNTIVRESDVIFVVVPSAFVQSVFKSLTVSLADKYVISAIKGLIPDSNMIVGTWLNQVMGVQLDRIGVISGPCHAEEVALERLSYLTMACQNVDLAREYARLITCHFIKTSVSDDIYGTEYAAVLKNIMAIASGVFHGLGYGDNFQAVLISNAIQEIKRFVDTVHPIPRDIKSSAYLGDLLVTAYSQFSRNRTFGTMLGKGYSVKSAQMEMLMVAEGYYATKSIKTINERYQVPMPITDCVYNIIYGKVSPVIECMLLTEQLR